MKQISILAAAVLVAGVAGLSAQKGLARMNIAQNSATPPSACHSYVGMWVTANGYIRHNLLPNGRYDEARGNRESAYQGRYEIRGNHIDYWDDTGFTADGTFIDGVLHHAGMILYREK
ncbi:hypothetical protein MesoLjLa_15720 [Mesorhizobium sp. L-2-11]|nr:hypothetical protein MesoLjLa_15720 [Mesorhizobium sp. L-2-11]